MDLIITGGKIITPFEVIEEGFIAVKRGIITDLGTRGKMPEISAGVEEFDARGYYVIPGMIDIHTHGARGHDVMDGTAEALREITRHKLGRGTTSWVGTTVTSSGEQILKAENALKNYLEGNPEESVLLGLHLEGPFISREKKGAQNEEFIRNPSLEEYREWKEHLGSYFKILTLAPEMEGALEIIKEAAEDAILVAAGHTNATYSETKKAMTAGLTHAAHFFNGMRSLHHREPGVIGAFLENPETTLELILDGAHLHPAIVRLVWKAAGPERIVLITDSMRAAGMPDGKYDLGGQEVTISDGIARLKDGTLAGSSLDIDRALRMMLEMVGEDLKTVLPAATINPARCLGVEGERGSLEPGKRADIVLLDGDLKPCKTITGGTVFNPEGGS